MTEQKNVTIFAPTAEAAISIRGMGTFLHDPERPRVGPNELLKEQGGMIDYATMNHNCPYCHKTMNWQLFKAHLQDTKEGPGCYRRWFKTIDITKRKFAGAQAGDANGND